jgi:hypothetical protein
LHWCELYQSSSIVAIHELLIPLRMLYNFKTRGNPLWTQNPRKSSLGPWSICHQLLVCSISQLLVSHVHHCETQQTISCGLWMLTSTVSRLPWRGLSKSGTDHM